MALNSVPTENNRLHVKLDQSSSQPFPSGHRAFDQASFLSAILVGHDAVAFILSSSYTNNFGCSRDVYETGGTFMDRGLHSSVLI